MSSNEAFGWTPYHKEIEDKKSEEFHLGTKIRINDITKNLEKDIQELKKQIEVLKNSNEQETFNKAQIKSTNILEEKTKALAQRIEERSEVSNAEYIKFTKELESIRDELSNKEDKSHFTMLGNKLYVFKSGVLSLWESKKSFFTKIKDFFKSIKLLNSLVKFLQKNKFLFFFMAVFMAIFKIICYYLAKEEK